MRRDTQRALKRILKAAIRAHEANAAIPPGERTTSPAVAVLAVVLALPVVVCVVAVIVALANRPASSGAGGSPLTAAEIERNAAVLAARDAAATARDPNDVSVWVAPRRTRHPATPRARRDH